MDLLFGGKDLNSMDWIPPEFQAAVKEPLEVLGCHKRSKVWEIRDSFRRICIENLQGSIFLPGSLCSTENIVNFKEALVAFRILMKDCSPPVDELTGYILSDLTLEHIGKFIEKSPLMNSKPGHMLMVLRPIPTIDLDYLSTSRACRMLHILHTGHGVGVSVPGSNADFLPFMEYTFQVYYCTRKWKITKRFSDFMELQERLILEFTTLPETLKKNILYKFGLGLKNHRAAGLATFVNEMHSLMAQKGVFSPRLTQFLGIDVERIHFEEEGRISKVIDSPVTLPWGSVWHPVDEMWLTRWRRFVLGRGARCYFPPGKITNLRLFQPVEVETKTRSGMKVMRPKLEPRPNLKLGHDYRALNFNMCNYLMIVHGGGPWISRSNRDIYSDPAQSYLQSVIRLQGFIRMSNAISERVRLQYRSYNSLEGVRLVLFEKLTETHLKDTQQRIKKARLVRKKYQLEDAVNFTINIWQRKTAREDPSTFQAQLVQKKQEQEMFAQADGSLEKAVDSGGLIVEALKPIISLPSIEEHHVNFTVQCPMNLELYYNSSMNHVVVVDLRNHQRDFKPRHASSGIEPVKMPIIEIGSVLLKIDGFPAADHPVETLTHRLSKSTYPIKVTFQRPLNSVPVSQLHELEVFRSKEVKHQMLKRLLVSGCRMKYHKKKKTVDSALWITSTHLSWREVNWQRNDSVPDFLKRNRLHYAYQTIFEENNVTREILERCNGKSCNGVAHVFTHAFQEIGVQKNDDDVELFKAVTAWGLEEKKADYDSRRGCCLYDIEYIRHGKGSKAFPSSANEDFCFIIALERLDTKKNKHVKELLAFEIVPPDGDMPPDKVKRLRNTLIWGLKNIVDEARLSKFFVGKTGEVHRRNEPNRFLDRVISESGR